MTQRAVQIQEDANYLKQVREQYENYPYPAIDPEEEYQNLRMPVTESFDRLNFYCYGGKRDFRKEFRSLVAGGGTGDAVIALAEQLRDTGNEVVYVDMSEASMKVAQQRAQIRGLSNIRWIRDSLLNIPQLGLGEFDYINCSGVLHHLADPDAGLKVLSDALKDDGAMGIMVYAQYGRMAVYMMQETLRLLNRNEPNLQRQVDNAKKVLGDLPMTNWMFNSSPIILSEISSGGDVGIYDLLLHSQDRAYTVPQLYDYVGKQGLRILQFFSDYQNISNRIYDPSFYLRDERLIAKVQSFPTARQQELAELLHSKIEKHTFYAMKRPAPLPSLEELDMVPFTSINIMDVHAVIAERIAAATGVVELYQQQADIRVLFPKGPQLEQLWAQCDGKRSLREIYRAVMDKQKSGGVNFQTLAAQFAPFYEAMHRAHWMYLRHKNTAAPLNHTQLQARVKPKGQA